MQISAPRMTHIPAKTGKPMVAFGAYDTMVQVDTVPAVIGIRAEYQVGTSHKAGSLLQDTKIEIHVADEMLRFSPIQMRLDKGYKPEDEAVIAQLNQITQQRLADLRAASAQLQAIVDS